MRRIFGFMLGIFVGWLIGAIAALLLAPLAGEELRDEIRARSTGFISEIQGAAETRRAQLEQELAAMRAPRVPSKTQ